MRIASASSRLAPTVQFTSLRQERHVLATIVAMSTEPLRWVRDHLSEVVDRIEREHERVVITRNGHDGAVIISLEDLAQTNSS